MILGFIILCCNKKEMTDWEFIWEAESAKSCVISLSPTDQSLVDKLFVKAFEFVLKILETLSFLCCLWSTYCTCTSSSPTLFKRETCHATLVLAFHRIVQRSGPSLPSCCHSLISMCSLVASCCAVASPRVPNMPTINKSDWLDCKGTANATHLAFCLL